MWLQLHKYLFSIVATTYNRNLTDTLPISAGFLSRALPGAGMKPVSVRFNEDELEALDQAVEEEQFHSRSQYIRWALKQFDDVRQHDRELLFEHEDRLQKLEEEVFNGE